MVTKYNVMFIPNIKILKKISLLRSKICKKVHSTQSLQYPVHMSLISGGFEVKDYVKFEKLLKLLCSQEVPLKLKTKKSTAVIPERFWTGIHINRTRQITELQKKLQKLRNQVAFKKEELKFYPLHITLAFPAKVEGLEKTKCPVSSMILDRITIVKKEKELGPYRIFKHIKIMKRK